MHLIEHIGSGTALFLGAFFGVVIATALRIVGRIRRLIRTATVLVMLGSLGAGGGPHIIHTLLTAWR